MRDKIKEFDDLLIGEKPFNVFDLTWDFGMPISGIINPTIEFEGQWNWGTGDSIIGIACNGCEEGENVTIRVVI